MLCCGKIGTHHLSAKSCQRKAHSKPTKLTKDDPKWFGYLKSILFLLQIYLTTRKKPQSWYLDSGYPWHMIGEISMFQSLTLMHGGTVTFRGNIHIREVALASFEIHSEEVIVMFVYLENFMLLKPFRPSFWY